MPRRTLYLSRPHPNSLDGPFLATSNPYCRRILPNATVGRTLYFVSGKDDFWYCDVFPGDRMVGPGQPEVGVPEHGLVVPLVEVQGRNILHRFALSSGKNELKPRIKVVFTLGKMRIMEEKRRGDYTFPSLPVSI